MRILRIRASEEYAAIMFRLYLWDINQSDVIVDDIDPWITCVWFA